MKIVKILMVVIAIAIVQMSKAQTEETITDEDLQKYALTMDSVKGMQQTLVDIVSENVQKNTVMSVKRYNELFKIVDDPAKLTAAKATDNEIAFVREIAALRQYNVDRINEAYQALAKDYVGVRTFNAIRKGLESDSQLKARYEAISKDIASQPAKKATTESKGK